MIVAGEASGDMHGARLVQAMREICPGLSFSGMGGDELQAAGVGMLFDAAKIAVVGLTEVLGHLGDILLARRILVEHMQKNRPALLILIDYPDFNLLLAAKAKKLGIPIFYYISPQVWAWRANRVNKIGRLADRIGVILPFEKKFYQQRGVPVDYVGHPLVDTVRRTKEREQFLAELNIAGDTRVVGLLPGSRSKEISSLLSDLLKAAQLVTDTHERVVFLLPKATTVSMELLQKAVSIATATASTSTLSRGTATTLWPPAMPLSVPPAR
jgi:lipid-A-disaccharide synthase